MDMFSSNGEFIQISLYYEQIEREVGWGGGNCKIQKGLTTIQFLERKRKTETSITSNYYVDKYSTLVTR